MSCPHLERCPRCPSRGLPPNEQKNVVPGDGLRDARVMIVLEAPGRQENNFRRPAVGKTGDELNGTYLPLAGLSRPDVYVTNAVKCHWADASDAPPDGLVKSCSEFHLRRELEQVKPETVVLAGGIACSLLGWDVELEHGLPRRNVNLLGHTCDVFPTFHPARGMHRSGDMQALLDDFKALRRFLRGELQPMVDEFPHPSFYRLRTRMEVQEFMRGRYWDEIAVDTESMKRWKGYKSTIRYIPWCATFCIDPGEAFMVRVEDEAAWDEFGLELRRFHHIDMHNAPHDWWVLHSSGITLEWNWIQDTMDAAYYDGRLAKGLKPLSYRLLGSRLRSFDDVVIPHGFTRAMEYIEQAQGIAWPKPEPVPTGEMVTKLCPECKGKMVTYVGRGKLRKEYPCDCGGGYVTVPKMSRKQGIAEKINRLVGDYLRNGDVDPWKRWEGWDLDVEPLIKRLGPIPLPSIEMAPEDEALEYACGDAHSTRRIAPILRSRIAGIRRAVR